MVRGIVWLRALGAVAAVGLIASLVTLGAGPAAGSVACPTVDRSTGVVTPAPSPGVDWAGCELNDANLSNANLAGADLSSASMYDVNLDSANLSDATLTSAYLDTATLTGATLSDATLTDANLTGVMLTGAALPGAAMGGATLTRVYSGGITGTPAALPEHWSLVSGYLMGPDADLAYASLAGVNAGSADLTGADVSQANVTATDLAGAVLTGIASGGLTGTPASLPGHWSLVGGYLVGPGANLSSAVLLSADLANADLTGASMEDADLTGADLADAQLTGADLQLAYLGGTDLGGAQLAGASMAGTSSGDVTGMPASLPPNWSVVAGYLVGPAADLADADLAGAGLAGLDLTGAHIENANLTGANLADASLTGASLYDSNLTSANLAGSNLSNAGLEGATVVGAVFTRAIWANTTCPDGSNSNSHDNGCFSPLDTTPPVARPTVTGGHAGRHGWYISPVTVTWNWTDKGTIVTAHCPASTTTRGSGDPITLRASCADLAGNVGHVTYLVKVDLTTPAVKVTGVRDGHRYIRGHVPAAGCRTTETVSGVAKRAAARTTTTGSRGLGTFTVTCSGAVSVAGTRQARPVRITYTVVR